MGVKKVIAVAILSAALGSAATYTVANNDPVEPVICAVEEDWPPVDCGTGEPADYENSAWWPKGTPDEVKRNWNK